MGWKNDLLKIGSSNDLMGLEIKIKIVDLNRDGYLIAVPEDFDQSGLVGKGGFLLLEKIFISEQAGKLVLLRGVLVPICHFSPRNKHDILVQLQPNQR